MAGKSTPKKAPAKIDVVVTIADGHHAAIAAVARDLKAAGLTAATTLKSAGLITGSVEVGSVANLKTVRGVKAVETTGAVQIAPPDSPIQ